jgi:hypothetical protein
MNEGLVRIYFSCRHLFRPSSLNQYSFLRALPDHTQWFCCEIDDQGEDSSANQVVSVSKDTVLFLPLLYSTVPLPFVPLDYSFVSGR